MLTSTSHDKYIGYIIQLGATQPDGGSGIAGTKLPWVALPEWVDYSTCSEKDLLSMRENRLTASQGNGSITNIDSKGKGDGD